MTTQQKAEALDSLSRLVIGMTLDHFWFARIDKADIGGDGMIAGSTAFGFGKSPADAIEELWTVTTTLPPGRYIVLDAYGQNRRQVRWSGYMWQDVQR